jgi:hypothetical protein
LNAEDCLITIPSTRKRRELTHFKTFEFEYFPVNAKVEETNTTDKAFDELD